MDNGLVGLLCGCTHKMYQIHPNSAVTCVLRLLYIALSDRFKFSTHTELNIVVTWYCLLGIRSTISSWTQWPLEAIDPYLHAGGEPDEKSVSMSSSAEKDSEHDINEDLHELYTSSFANPWARSFSPQIRHVFKIHSKKGGNSSSTIKELRRTTHKGILIMYIFIHTLHYDNSHIPLVLDQHLREYSST